MLTILLAILGGATALAFWQLPAWGLPVAIISVVFFLVILQFFRNPARLLPVGDRVRQGEDFGFIKFGSRVDLFLPLGTELEVELNQKVKGNKTVIGRLG